VNEGRNGRIDRAVKHWIIAANLGHDGSIRELKNCYMNGYVSKEDFATALRAHQAAVDATKSPQRDAACSRGIGQLNYEMRNYLGNLKATIMGTALFVYCLFRFIHLNHHCIFAAPK